MTDRVPQDSPKHSSNPVVRIVAHQTSSAQPDTISKQRVELHARHGSLDVDSVEGLLDDAVDDGELETAPEEDLYRIADS